VPPGPSGGVVAQGTYVLTQVVLQGPGDASGGPLPQGTYQPETFRMGSGSFDWLFATDGSPIFWRGRIRTTGSEMMLDVECPSTRAGVRMMYGLTPAGFWTCGPTNGTTCIQDNSGILRLFTRAP
jgi:hypothetical protein